MASVIALLFLVVLLLLDRDSERDAALLAGLILVLFFWYLVPRHPPSDEVQFAASPSGLSSVQGTTVIPVDH